MERMFLDVCTEVAVERARELRRKLALEQPARELVYEAEDAAGSVQKHRLVPRTCQTRMR